MSAAGHIVLPDGRLDSDVPHSQIVGSIRYEEDENDAEFKAGLMVNENVMVTDGEKGIALSLKHKPIFHKQCNRHFLKRFAGRDVKIVRDLQHATSKASVEAILNRPFQDGGLSDKARSVIDRYDLSETTAAHGPFETMHRGTQSSAESLMAMLAKPCNGIPSVRDANDQFTVLQRSMNMLENNYQKLKRSYENDVASYPDAKIVPYVRKFLREKRQEILAQQMTLINETRQPEGRIVGVLRAIR